MYKPYTLPELPYVYSALEPHYSARLLKLHDDKHHAAYVAGANTTQDKLAEAREKSDFAAISSSKGIRGWPERVLWRQNKRQPARRQRGLVPKLLSAPQ